MSSDNSSSSSSSGSGSSGSSGSGSAINFALAKLMNATPVLKINLKETHPPLIQFIITQQGLPPSEFDEQFKILIKNGENVNQKDSNGYTVLDYAFVFANSRICIVLMNKGAKFSDKFTAEYKGKGGRSRKNKSRKSKSRKNKSRKNK